MKKTTREGIIKIILHVLAWFLLLGLPFYSAKRFQLGNDFLFMYYSMTLISGLIFYINYLFLVPRFFFQKRKYKYYLSALLLVIGFYFISDFSVKVIFSHISDKGRTEQINRADEEGRGPGPPRAGIMGVRYPFRGGHIVSFAGSSLFLIFFSLGLRVLERQSKIEKMQEEMEKEKLNSELAFLKNQISPHFFFNTMNNIYSLIGINAEDSQSAVLKLSKLMRYLLYESEEGKTILSNEIDFMNNYIDLMKLRMSEKVDLSVSFPVKYEDRNIPPLLFIPFIENSFKHGVSYREKSFINIDMQVAEDIIIFRCSNSVPDGDKNGTNGGIGLENIRKRLNLLFPGSHELRISRSEKQFDVSLEINSAR
jgi:hypothetical protein